MEWVRRAIGKLKKDDQIISGNEISTDVKLNEAAENEAVKIDVVLGSKAENLTVDDGPLQENIQPVERGDACVIDIDLQGPGDVKADMKNYKVREHADTYRYNDRPVRYDNPNVSQGGRTAGNNQQVVVSNSGARHGRRRPDYDDESSADFLIILFEDPEVRQDFIRKVYSILGCQLIFTFGFIAFCIYYKYARMWVLDHYWITYIAMGLMFMTSFIMCCCPSTRRAFPCNFVLLSLMTVSLTYIAAFFSCFYATYIVMSAFAGTAGIVILITIIAWQDWFDITTWGMYLAIGAIILVVYGFIAMIVYLFTGCDVLYLIYSCIACLLFCMFLLYDTQMIVGGKRISLSPEEYVMGAVQLYMDIVLIFIFLLDIIGYASR